MIDYQETWYQVPGTRYQVPEHRYTIYVLPTGIGRAASRLKVQERRRESNWAVADISLLSKSLFYFDHQDG